jgi:hypothetical protein
VCERCLRLKYECYYPGKRKRSRSRSLSLRRHCDGEAGELVSRESRLATSPGQTAAVHFTQLELAVTSESTATEPLIPCEPDSSLPFVGESFWEPDFFQFLLNTEPQNPSFLFPITSSLEPKTLLPCNLSIPNPATLESIESFFDFDKNTHYIPFIHKGLLR